MMEIERVEVFGDAAHRRDLRVVGSGRHVTPVRQRGVKVVSFVAKRVEQRPANHHHALMRAQSTVGRKQINIDAEHGEIRAAVRGKRTAVEAPARNTDEPRLGEECDWTCRYRWAQHEKKKNT